MPKISAICPTREIKVPFDNGSELTVVLDKSAITPRFFRSLAARSVDAEATYDEVVALLSACLKSWDLEDEKGKVIPCNEEGISQVPYEVLNAVVVAIKEAQGADPLN
jgi:hypothetical protein